MAAEITQAYISIDETTRVARPRLATGEGTATAGADRAVVAPLGKDTADCKDVLEWSAVYADLQYSAVKPILQSVVIPEKQSRRSDGIDCAGR